MSRRLGLLAALAIVTIIGGACSNAGTDSSSGTDTSAIHEQALKFAECMRDNGVTEFPDPDASGDFTIEEIANGSSVDTDSAAFEQASTACKELEPPGFTGDKRTPEQQAAALVFAQCIRDHGVEDFPDPGPDDPLVDTNRIPSLATSEDLSILNAAMQQCDASAAGVTDGR